MRTCRRQLSALSLFPLVLVLALACFDRVNGPIDDPNNHPGSPKAAAVIVQPASARLYVGGQIAITATPKDASGNPLPGEGVSWSSTDPTIATVSPSGEVSAVAPGTADIIATSDSSRGVVGVTVSNVPVTSVAISPSGLALHIGETGQLSATPKDSIGESLGGRSISWSSSNTSVATVSASGLVRAVAVGGASISATSEGRSSSIVVAVSLAPVATISVQPASLTLQIGNTSTLSATLKDANGSTLTGRTVTWSTSNNGVATVSAAGVVNAKAAGSATITATSEGKTGTASISVPAATVRSVSISPSSVTLITDATQQYAAIATWSDGSSSPITASWSATGGTITSSGLYTAGKSKGKFKVKATTGGASDSGTVTITSPTPPPPAAVASVSVDPNPASVQVGATVQLTATAEDSTGAVLNGQTVSWSSGNSAVATVSASGLVTGVAAGSTTITATSGGVSGTTSVTVTAAPPVPVATVSLSPNSVSLQPGATQQLSATELDANGNTLSGRTVSWSSANTGVATVSGSGMVTGVAAGSTTITATSGGVSGTASVTVTTPSPAPVATVSLSPNSVSLQLGATQQLSAKELDANGNTLSGRAVTWSSANTGIASVSSSGLVTAVAAGVTTVTATSEGQSGTATVIALTPTLTSITLSPSSASLQTGATKQFTVTGAWSDGASRAVTPTFSASGGTISTGGLYAAGNTAGAYRVVASQGSVADSSTVTVTAPAPTLTGITVSPASASITAGSTQQFTASGTFSDGSTGAVTVSWSVNGGSITSSGLYTAPSSAGTYTVTATGGSGSVTGTASVTVTVSSPPPTGEPVPTSTSKVFFDTRPGGAQDYQKLNSLQEALAVWDVGYRGPVAWTTNMDGNGKHALRWDWSGSPTEQDGVVERSLPSVTGRMVTSWKIHLGRTSTGGGVGNVGYYGLNNGGGTKRFLWLRQDGTYRIYLVWRDYPSNDYNTFAIDGVSWNSNPISGNPYAYVGQEQRWTVEMVLPNTIRAWVNGVKVLDQSNANLGTTPFTSIQTPATMNYPAADMSEYWYDVVVWQ